MSGWSLELSSAATLQPRDAGNSVSFALHSQMRNLSLTTKVSTPQPPEKGLKVEIPSPH